MNTAVTDRSRRRLAWAAPVVVGGVVAVAVALSGGTASGSSPDLPAISAAHLLAAVQSHQNATFSGQVAETANLGLPTLPGGQGGASLSWQTFLTGTHTARVWANGAGKQRLALVGELSEADVVHNGRDLWTYTSDTNTVTHTTLAAHADAGAASTPAASDLTPAAAAAKALASVNPTTAVSVQSTRTVAGRDAYTLVLRPRDTRSTVHRITIAVDAKTYLPLQVQVYGASSAPALSTGFTSISYTRPASSTFVFHTPKGATTSADPLGVHGHDGKARPATPSARTGTTPSATPKTATIGTGWTTIVELPRGAGTSLGGSTLHELTSSIGSDGARLLHTALVNAVILADGRTFVGAVSPALLEHVAATTPR